MWGPLGRWVAGPFDGSTISKPPVRSTGIPLEMHRVTYECMYDGADWGNDWQ